MPGAKQLTKKQLDVIEDLFAGELEEQAILNKHKLSRKLYNQWRNDESFADQFEKRITDAYRQSDVLIARYAPVAAAKLIQLTESDKPETAPKSLPRYNLYAHTNSQQKSSALRRIPTCRYSASGLDQPRNRRQTLGRPRRRKNN